MELHLEAEDRLRLTLEGAGLVVEPGEATSLSPFHLLAASLATCTFSVLHSWAHHAELSLEGLEIVVDWAFSEAPVRVSAMGMELVWPSLPPERRAAAARVAAECTIHHTLEHGTRVETRVAEPTD